jgi:hypothetical protein
MRIIDARPHIQRVMKLKATDRLGSGSYMIAGRSRLATATDVRVLDAERIAVINLVGQTLTVGRWSNRFRRYRREHVIGTRNQDGATSCDLMDSDGHGMLVTSDCHAGSVSLYAVEDGRPEYVRSIVPESGSRGFCHGVTFIPGSEGLIALAYSIGVQELVIAELESGRERAVFSLPGWKPKAIAVDAQGRFVVPFCDGGPGQRADDPDYGTRVLRLSFDPVSGSLLPLDEVALPGVHVDSSVIVGDVILVNNQTHDAIDVIESTSDGMTVTRRVTGFSFPHGAALSWDRNHLLVCQYGDRSVVSVPLSVILG